MITQTYTLSLQPGGVPIRVPCVQGDALSRTLQFQLTSSGAAAKLPAGAGVTLEGTKPDGKSFSVAGTLSDDVASVTLTDQMTAAAGSVPCQLTIASGTELLGTGRLILEVAPAAIPANADLSDSDVNLLTQMKTAVNQLSAGKADKKTPSAAKNVALLDAGGNLLDSGMQLTPSGIGAESKGTGLYGFTAIPANSDLNEYTACGYYGCNSSETVTTLLNCPVTIAFTMCVISSASGSDYNKLNGTTWKYRVQRLMSATGVQYIREIHADGDGNLVPGEWKRVLYYGDKVSVAEGVADYGNPSKTIQISAGSWTPTVSGASSYTLQTGRYLKLGDMAIVSFSVYGTFSGSKTARIAVSGCPLTPADGQACGGGQLSGYTAASSIVFTGWQVNASDQKIYAVGQETGTTEGVKWGKTEIYQTTGGDFFAGGTIAFRVADVSEI